MKNHFRLPIWLVPLALAGLVALLGWWGNDRLRETVDDEVVSDLTSTLDANVTALEIWTTNQVKIGTALAGEPGLRALAMQALRPGLTDGSAQGSADLASDQLSQYLRSRLTGLGYEIAHLIDTNFLVIA